MDNIGILNKLYLLKKEKLQCFDLLIIDNLIVKYNTESISVDVQYTDKELKGSKYVFRNILNRIFDEPDPWTMNEEKTEYISVDEVLFDKIKMFYDEAEKLILKYSLLRIKNNKTKNPLSYQNSILIQNIFIEEINELITKFFKL